jgi:branched-chain amino acid transport system permease protein
MALTEILISALILSAAYCLVSAGLALLVGVGNVCDCGFGSYMIMAPYVMVQAVQWFGPIIGLFGAVLSGLIVVIIIGYLFHKFLISPLRPDNFAIMMMTMGIALAIQELLIILWGNKNIAVPTIADGATMIFGVYILKQRLLSAGIAIVILILLILLIYKTKLGIAMRAVSENPVAGSILGVDNERIYLFIGVLGAVLAAAAGIMITPISGLSPSAWMEMGLIPWAIITVGGWGRLWTIFPASLIIGFAEVIAAYSFPGGAYLKRSIALGIMLIVVITRPRGIAGLRGWGAY